MVGSDNTVTILNVDDNEGARYAKSRVLKRAGFGVLEASTGRDAIAMARECQPELVLLDVKLPDVSGLEVCRQIKAESPAGATLVLQTSAALIDSKDRVRALEGGADSYLVEPIEPEELIASIKALLRMRHAEEAFRQAESELRASKERLELAQQAGRVGTFDWDIARNQMIWSQTEQEIFGLRPGDFGGHYADWWRMLHPDDRERVEAAIQRSIEERTPFSTEYRVITPAGETRWIAAHGKVFYDDAGRPTSMLGVNSDVTERKATEVRINKLVDELRDADRRKDEFLAMLAHELRNPLAPIRSALEVLSTVPAEDARLAWCTEVLSRQTNQLVRLVDDLLDVSRLTQGKIRIEPRTISLKEVVEGAIEMCMPLIERHHQRLTKSLPRGPVVVEGDSMRLTQAVYNLLSNASKYNEDNGSIEVAVERGEGELFIRVRDSGRGIPAELLPHVFDLFTQGDQSLARLQGGLGVGLTIVRSIVELHGGSVSVHSEGLGRGSEFTLRLPARAVSPVPAPDREPATRLPLEAAKAARRVLVVDDNMDSADAMAMLLKVLGHEVRSVYTGRAALELAPIFDPDLILLDIGLPDMDGFETARLLQERMPGLANHRVAIAALTGYGRAEDRARTMASGFDHHLVKPVELNTLKRILESLDRESGLDRDSSGAP